MDFSKLMLGTVQFGLNYGIANTAGQPSYETARDIIKIAYDGGVNCLDTAAAYGNSEEVLGRALDELGLLHRMHVITKIPSIGDTCSNSREAEAFIETSLTQSLRRLRLDCVEGCLFHHDSDHRFLPALFKMKAKGMVRHIGVSVVKTPDAVPLLETESEMLQIPFNLIDRRPDDCGLFARQRQTGTVLFVRSVYLQGLLLMPEHKIIPELGDVIPVRRVLQRLADAAGIEFAALCLRYAMSTKEVSSVLFGVDTVEQARQNVAELVKPPLPDDLMSEIKAVVKPLPEICLSPSCWPKSK